MENPWVEFEFFIIKPIDSTVYLSQVSFMRRMLSWGRSRIINYEAQVYLGI